MQEYNYVTINERRTTNNSLEVRLCRQLSVTLILFMNIKRRMLIIFCFQLVPTSSFEHNRYHIIKIIQDVYKLQQTNVLCEFLLTTMSKSSNTFFAIASTAGGVVLRKWWLWANLLYLFFLNEDWQN